jgi:hypothetical protein
MPLLSINRKSRPILSGFWDLTPQSLIRLVMARNEKYHENKNDNMLFVAGSNVHA